MLHFLCSSAIASQPFSVCTWSEVLRKCLVKFLAKVPSTYEWPSYFRGYHILQKRLVPNCRGNAEANDGTYQSPRSPPLTLAV